MIYAFIFIFYFNYPTHGFTFKLWSYNRQRRCIDLTDYSNVSQETGCWATANVHCVDPLILTNSLFPNRYWMFGK